MKSNSLTQTRSVHIISGYRQCRRSAPHTLATLIHSHARKLARPHSKPHSDTGTHANGCVYLRVKFTLRFVLGTGLFVFNFCPPESAIEVRVLILMRTLSKSRVMMAMAAVQMRLNGVRTRKFFEMVLCGEHLKSGPATQLW